MSEKEFLENLALLGINLSEEQVNQFREYAAFLLEYNSHTNLTAFKTLEEVYLKHFYDSLLLIKYKSLTNQKVLDIGTGAGFPGVPLKIVFPNIDLTLLESNGKKTKFLEELREKLETEYKIVNDRAENYIGSARESFDIVTSRAVTTMSVLAELSLPFVKIGGEFIPYKGNLDESLEEGIYAIEVLGGNISKVEKTILPIEKAIRTFVFVTKNSKTDEKYPRQYDKIVKKPLKKN